MCCVFTQLKFAEFSSQLQLNCTLLTMGHTLWSNESLRAVTLLPVSRNTVV